MITKRIAEIVADRGVTLTRIAEVTGIPYQAIQASLKKDGTRQLRADELVKVCKFLELNPLEW